MSIVAELTMDDIANGTFPDTSHAQRFQQAVTQAAATLTTDTGVPFNQDHLQEAMDLVLSGAVEAHGDGTYTVKSGAHTYEILDECACQDSQHRTRYCKHYLASMLWKGAQSQLVPVATNGNGRNLSPARESKPQPEPTQFGGDSESLPKPPQLDGDPESLSKPTHCDSFPESTCCVKDVIGGREISWTLRGDDTDVSSCVQRVIQFLDSLKESAPEPQPTSEHWCSEHKTPFKHNSNAKGTWYSHRLADGSWCKEK
jgi:hypothetical protein